MIKSIVPLLITATALTANAGFSDFFSSKEKKPEAQTAPAAKAPEAPAAAATATATDLADSLKARIAEASKSALEEAKALIKDPATAAPVKEQLTKLADSLTGGKDGAAAEALAKIVALKPTEQQMGLVKELQAHVGTLVLGRNFNAADPASGGAVKAAIDAIKAKDTAGIIGNLQKLADNNKLTDAQKQMAGNLLASWSPKLAAAAEKAKAGVEKLKGFGL